MERASQIKLIQSIHSSKTKQINLLSFFFMNEIEFFWFHEWIKKYYNSKLIEQLADNIKTKFIWFLWRKQVVKAAHEINWIHPFCSLRMSGMRWNSFYFIGGLPFAAFERACSLNKAKEGRAACSFSLGGYGRGSANAPQREKTSQNTNQTSSTLLIHSFFSSSRGALACLIGGL